LICTDAASEGLNLQAAGAVINYDLPWNPSKVEQRIGRIDRIGQKLAQVRVVNLFLRDSVDERVYGVLRTRCGLFEHFVGAMQPVLARARRMLLGQEQADPAVLETAVVQVGQDPMASENYEVESAAVAPAQSEALLTRQQVETALVRLQDGSGLRVKVNGKTGECTLSGAALPKAVFSDRIEVLERDHTVRPLSPLEPRLRELAEHLDRHGERLPLVVGSYQRGAFRCSVAYWVGNGELRLVQAMGEMEQLVGAWDGTYPDPDGWLKAQEKARQEAQAQVQRMEEEAAEREAEGLQRQREAAYLRLRRELGRYLVCLGEGTANLNDVFYRQMARDTAGAQRLTQCYERLGGYPAWDLELCRELGQSGRLMTENQRAGRLLGRELEAALGDPRWGVVRDTGFTEGARPCNDAEMTGLGEGTAT
jgi:hypothetical protein